MRATPSSSEPPSAITASAVPPALRTCSTVSLTPSARSTAISLAPSLVNSSDAARPMPLPAPVMMTDLPSRRPMHFLPCNFMLSDIFQREPASDLIRGDYQFAPENPHKKYACRLAEFQTRFQTPKLLESRSRKANLLGIKSLEDKLLEETCALT